MPAPSAPRQPPSVQRGWRRMFSAAAGRSGPHGPYAGAGGNYANWPFGAVEAPVFAAIAEGERFLFALEEA